MTQLEISKPTIEGSFKGCGYVLMPFALKGRIEPCGTSTFKVAFTQTYDDDHIKICTGTFDGKTGVIAGTWRYSYEAENIGRPLHLIKMPPSLYRFRYSDTQFTSHPARARWNFACFAVLYQVRRRLWSWNLIKERCEEKRRFVDLMMGWEMGGSGGVAILTEDEDAEFNALKTRLSTADHMLYNSVYELHKKERFRVVTRQWVAILILFTFNDKE